MAITNLKTAASDRSKRMLRGGFSLMELLAVSALIAIVAAAGIARYGGGTLGSLGARTDARRIALDLLQAQRRTIATGDNHLIRFTPAAASPTSYTILQRSGGGTVTVEATREIASGVTVTASHVDCEYTFDGTALAAYSITVVGGGRTWQISVVPATGNARVVEL